MLPMRTITLLILLVLSVGITASAHDTLRLKQQNRFAVSLQLNSPNPDRVNVGWFDIDVESIDDYNLKHKSFSVGAALTYALSPETKLRLRLARTNIWVEEYNDFRYERTSNWFEKEQYRGEQVKYQIAPGIIWALRHKKLELVAGFELPINLHGEYVFTSSITTLNEDKSFKSYGESQTIIPEGLSVGLGAVAGFNYYVHERLSVGAEFSPALLYSSFAGETYNRTTKIIPEIPDYVDSPHRTQDANEGYTFYEQRFSLGVSYRFGK